MPGFDGTGPVGRGSMTGGGRGYCLVAYDTTTQKGFGRGLRRRCTPPGFSGWNRLGYSTIGREYVAAVDEKELLSKQAEYLEDQLQQVKKRLKAFAGDDE